MKRAMMLLVLALAPLSMVNAAGGPTVDLGSPAINLGMDRSLQRGAKYYVNYCSGCHSMQHLRYSRIAQDLNIPEDLLKASLMVTGEKIGDHMKTAMPASSAERWFGVLPPDLTLVSRSRGADWLYGYLKGFYLDESKLMGVNNVVFKDVGMPHVLWEQQGWQRAKFIESTDEDGVKHKDFDGFEQVTKGTMSEQEYDRLVTDLVTFMVYAGEPIILERKALGVKVILFLLIFVFVSYLLKREFWKDVH